MAEMTDLAYVAEKFHSAVHALVKSGRPKTRLHDAYMCFQPVELGAFQDHPELGAKYQDITDAITAKPPAGMPESEAQQIIDLIVDFTFLVDDERR
jgi:hypothetical protein